MPFGIGFFATAGAAAGGTPAFELISSQVLTSDTATVTFSSIPQTYRHLQVRYVGQTTRNQTDNLQIRFNSDSGLNYVFHDLTGNSSNVQSQAGLSQTRIGPLFNSYFHNAWTAGVMDVLDYSSTSKNTTARILQGMPSSDLWRVQLYSGLWMNTSAVSSITFSPLNGPSLYAGSRFSLYGIKG